MLSASVCPLRRDFLKCFNIIYLVLYILLRNNPIKASTTICKLVLIFLSQFFHNRRYFSSHAKERSTTQRFGITTNLCNSFEAKIPLTRRKKRGDLSHKGRGEKHAIISFIKKTRNH